MGNLFSGSSTNSPDNANAPEGQYTLTPKTTSTTTTTTTDADGTTSNNENCNTQTNSDGTVIVNKTVVTTSTGGAEVPSKQVDRNNEDDENKFMDFIDNIFNATTYTILFWILFVYCTYLLFTAIYKNRGMTNESNGVATYSRTVDIIICFLFFSFLFSVYYRLDDEDKKNIFGYTIEWTENYFQNPWSVFELIWFTIIFFALIYVLRVPMTPEAKPITVDFVEAKIWIVYLIFAIIFFFKYALNIQIVSLMFNNSVMNYFKNVQPYQSDSKSPSIFSEIIDDTSNINKDIYDNQPTTTTTTTTKSIVDEDDIILVPSPGASPGDCGTDKQVFNVSNNLYTYEEAQKVCSAFDASLATYDQIEGAYDHGAEWCNYGWSDGQMAYYPTQKHTWEALQDNPNTKHICGRPGINGGFIDNPYVRFGANCYGVKPKQPDGWEPPSYVNNCGIEKDDPNQKMRDQAQLNSFNGKRWSRY